MAPLQILIITTDDLNKKRNEAIQDGISADLIPDLDGSETDKIRLLYDLVFHSDQFESIMEMSDKAATNWESIEKMRLAFQAMAKTTIRFNKSPTTKMIRTLGKLIDTSKSVLQKTGNVDQIAPSIMEALQPLIEETIQDLSVQALAHSTTGVDPSPKSQTLSPPEFTNPASQGSFSVKFAKLVERSLAMSRYAAKALRPHLAGTIDMCYVHRLENGFPVLLNFYPSEMNTETTRYKFDTDEGKFHPTESPKTPLMQSPLSYSFHDLTYKTGPGHEEKTDQEGTAKEPDEEGKGEETNEHNAQPPVPEPSTPPQEDEDEGNESPPIGTGRWNRRRRRRHSSTTPEPEQSTPKPPNQQGGQRGHSPSSDQDDLEPQFLDDLHERAAEQIKLHNNYDELPNLHDHHKRFGASDDTPHNIDVSELDDDDLIVQLTDSSTSVRFMITFNEATRKPIFNRIIDPRRRRFS